MDSQPAAGVADGCPADAEQAEDQRRCSSPSPDTAVGSTPADAESAAATGASDSQRPCSEELGIEILNPEVIRLIFGYLDVQNRGRVAQVCTTWRAIADERCIWVDVEARLRLSECSASVLDCLARRGIRRVKVLGFKGDQVAQLVRALPHMKSLDLSDNFSVNNSVVLGAFEQRVCESLAILNLSWCPQIDDSAIDCLTNQLPNLEELYLIACDHITDSSMAFVAARLTRLRVLDVKECEVSSAGLQQLAGFCEDGVLSATLGAKALTHLGLEDCALVSDAGLESISLGLLHLSRLDLSMCLGITDAGFEHVGRMTSLKNLALAGCEDLTGLTVHHLAAGRFSLTSLDIAYCNHIDDDAISNVSRGSGLLTLRTLNITACPVTDVGVSALAQKLTDLRVLNISECDLVTKEGIAVVSAHLRRLRAIHMRLCMGLTNIALKHLSRISSLEVVNLKGCSKLRNKAMAYMAPGKTQSNILELDVSFTAINDAGARYIAQSMQKLRSLNLSGCMVGDKGMARIARSLGSLSTLKISRCHEISDNGIKTIACNLKNLKAIDIKGCPRTTSAGRRCLIARLPNLKFL
ncbi:uncharacterized protein [Dermacentor andersoni]|uniref:uncharacterized protein n=1 Tax=Dermacentor andersoni TaxID=34620 RepID=UPI00215533BD|nr:F-box/LRR-repeat protein 14-like [Dermacentor andersoni]